MSRVARIASGIALLAMFLPGPGLAGEVAPPQAEQAAPAESALRATHNVSGRIARIEGDRLVVETSIRPGGKRYQLQGGKDTQVAGKKSEWSALRRGDFVSVTYDPRRTPSTLGLVYVFPASALPKVAEMMGKKPVRKREFIGWIKQVDGESLVVRTPNMPPPSRAPGRTMKFVKQDDAVVEGERDTWSSLKKGDRIHVFFGKGRPRPATRILVLLRGGEQPLPPGLASRLYDPLYDDSVKDVDGIGEVRPGDEAPSAEEAGAAGG